VKSVRTGLYKGLTSVIAGFVVQLIV